MNNHQEETTNFEFTVTRDGVANSGISNNSPIVVDTSNTLSWSINECSSSFQSVSSCETIGSYEQSTINTESPQVIIVPFITDNVTNTEMAGTVITNNGVHCPIIKECSIRIDQLKMPPHFVGNREETIIDKIIELPFSSNCSTDKYPSADDDSSEFGGFDDESKQEVGTESERYKRVVKKNEMGRSTERNKTIDTVKRPRHIQRKISKPQLSDNQIEPINQSRIDNAPIHLPTSQQNNSETTMKTPEILDRISSPPIINLETGDNKKDSSSDSSDSDSDEVTPVTVAVNNSGNNRKDDRSTDVKNNNKQKEIERMEKMRRRKELNLVADRIRDHWRETYAAAKRKQRKKEKKSKMENDKYKTYYTKNDIIQYQYRGRRKKKRVPYTSDSDSSDSSNTSKTSSSSSSDSSNDSDTTRASDTSYTSQTSHVTDSDSSDTDSSDVHSRSRHHINRRRMSSPATTDTSDTSSDDDSFDKKRKFHFLKKAIYRKQSKSKNDDICSRSKKRKSESCRPVHLHQKKKKRSDLSNRPQINSKRTKNNSQKQHFQKNLNFASRSSTAKSRKIKTEFAKRAETESTSAGDFSVNPFTWNVPNRSIFPV